MVKKKTKSFNFLVSIKHFLIPHKSNNYKPHAIRWQSLTLTATVSLITHASYVYFTTGQIGVLGKTVQVDISSLADETNSIRKENNLAELVVDKNLSIAAQSKADDMINNNYWSHNSPSGKTPWDFIHQTGYKYQSAGENLAKNYPDSGNIIEAWMSSETHRQNILNKDFTSMGFGSAEGVINAKINTIVVAYYAKSSDVKLPISSTNDVLGVRDYSYTNNPLTYIGSLIKNLNPITIGTVVMIVGLIIIAFISHLFRDYVPKNIQKSLLRHHAILKASILVVVLFAIIVFSNTQSI